ncbi:MAG: hypothetical protein ACP5NW_03160 [Candidatus Woesearchaeota archaeon]
MPPKLGEKFEILDTPLLIKYKGVFDFDGMYKMMHTWLVSKRFLFQEDTYKDKIYTPFGNELEITWNAERKVTEFIKEYITIEFHLWDFAEAEVIKDGKKTKMTKARMEMKIFAYLELDYSKKFSEGDSFSKKLGQFYMEKIIYWDWRIRYANVLEYNIYDLHTKIKKYLNMDTATNAY